MLIKTPKVKKKDQPPVKDQYTDEILVPWGTLEDKLKELGLA